MPREFIAKINEYVKTTLENYLPQKTSEKVIHDPIWGSVMYYGWEIQLIDSPLFQRLRNITQLGRADLTYPAARHTRFEHSLGTVAIASRMMDNLQTRSAYPITVAEKNQVRLAALLHDVGHCFYSHLSERVYSKMPEFTEMRKELRKSFDKGVNPKGHEIFSYMIIRSDEFCKFFAKNIDYPEKGDFDFCKKLLEDCSNMVIGQNNFIVRDNKKIILSFMTEVLNSDFDADKLDYTQRDSYSSGLALTYGIERFLMKIIVCTENGKNKTDYRLAIRSDAVTTVEELLFNRNMLYVYMYRHQKVLAVESVIMDIIYEMLNRKIITHPCDFLYYTDRNMESPGNPEIYEMINRLENRFLPKRAYVALPDERNIIENLFKNEDSNSRDGYKKIRKLFFDLIVKKYKSMRKTVEFSENDIYPVFPSTTNSTAQFLVSSRDGKKPIVNKFLYIKEWSAAFNMTNWRGYVFVNPCIDREIAEKAIKKFLKGQHKNEN